MGRDQLLSPLLTALGLLPAACARLSPASLCPLLTAAPPPSSLLRLCSRLWVSFQASRLPSELRRLTYELALEEGPPWPVAPSALCGCFLSSAPEEAQDVTNPAPPNLHHPE